MVPVRYNLRSLLERRATSLMTVLGLGMVAMIFVILFGFIGGLKSTMLNASADRNWVLLSKGAPNETASFIGHDPIAIVQVRPEIALDEDGKPLVSKEVFAGVNISRDKHVRQFVQMRGVTPIALRVHRNMHLVSGRWPIRGQGEWTIGQKVQARQPYLTIGSQVHFGRRNWTIVGVFADDDSARESEIWTDYNDLLSDVQYKGGSGAMIFGAGGSRSWNTSAAAIFACAEADAWRLEGRAGDRHALLLAAGQFQPALADPRLVSLRERDDKVMDMRVMGLDRIGCCRGNDCKQRKQSGDK